MGKEKEQKQNQDSAVNHSPQLYIETYGCQMNIADSEVVLSIMEQNGYAVTKEIDNADVILINTCSVRDNAEQRIRKRLVHLNRLKKDNSGLMIGIIGEIKNGNKLFYLGLLAIIGKLATESFTGPADFTGRFINANVITAAHLSGAIIGGMTGCIIVFIHNLLTHQSFRIKTLHAE